jgi:hypothetical protein
VNPIRERIGEGLGRRLVSQETGAGRPPRPPALLRQPKEGGIIVDQMREWERLAAQRVERLSESVAAAVAAFAETARLGLADATPADRYDTLRLRGMVVADPQGVHFGRLHRFRVEWAGAIPLRRHDIRSSQAIPS